jgi:hypothetical protein
MKYFLALFALLFSMNVFATTSYVLSPVEGLQNATSPGPYVGIVIGKKAANLTPKETAATDECGNYWDGMGYSDSVTYNAELTGKWLVITGSQDDFNRMNEWYWVGTAPSRAAKVHTISIYKEGTTDDGICTQDGITYYKYSLTHE